MTRSAGMHGHRGRKIDVLDAACAGLAAAGAAGARRPRLQGASQQPSASHARQASPAVAAARPARM